MAIKIRTVDGVSLSTLKKVAIYVFGAHRFMSLVENNNEVKILVSNDTSETEIARFQKYWNVRVSKVA